MLLDVLATGEEEEADASMRIFAECCEPTWQALSMTPSTLTGVKTTGSGGPDVALSRVRNGEVAGWLVLTP